MRIFLKEIFKFIFAAIYLIYRKLVKQKPYRIVIYYHGIAAKDVERFQEQMEYLAKKFVVLKVSQINNMSIETCSRAVAITFDDAFENVMKNAEPILKKLNLPFAVFVPTGSLGQTPGWKACGCEDQNNSVMTAEQIEMLDKTDVQMFSHTVSHPELSKIDDDQLQFELGNSKKTLEDILGHEVNAVSYPHGDCNERVYEFAHKAGYKLGFTIIPGNVANTTDPLRISRIKILPNDPMIIFKLKVSGAYNATRVLSIIKKSIPFYRNP